MAVAIANAMIHGFLVSEAAPTAVESLLRGIETKHDTKELTKTF